MLLFSPMVPTPRPPIGSARSVTVDFALPIPPVEAGLSLHGHHGNDHHHLEITAVSLGGYRTSEFSVRPRRPVTSGMDTGTRSLALQPRAPLAPSRLASNGIYLPAVRLLCGTRCTPVLPAAPCRLTSGKSAIASGSNQADPKEGLFMKGLVGQFLGGVRAWWFCWRHSKALWRVTAEESKGRHMPRALRTHRSVGLREPLDTRPTP